jgi:hypothetical protein
MRDSVNNQTRCPSETAWLIRMDPNQSDELDPQPFPYPYQLLEITQNIKNKTMRGLFQG